MPLLGKLPVFKTIRDFGRKYGVFLWGICQSLGQLEEIYGKEDTRAWLGVPEVIQIFGVNEYETAKMICDRSGDFTVVQESTGRSSGRSGREQSGSTSKTNNRQGTKAALITPDEVLTLYVDENGVPDEQILFIRGRH